MNGAPGSRSTRGASPRPSARRRGARRGARSAARVANSRRTAQKPSSTTAGRLLQAGEVGDRLGDRVSIVIRREQRLDLAPALVRPVALVDPAACLTICGERPERDALAVREGTAPGAPSPVAEDRPRTRERSRDLPMPGRTDDRDEPAASLSVTARSSAHSSWASVSRRPTRGASSRERRIGSLAGGRAGGRHRSRRACPSARGGASRSASTTSRTSRNVDSASRISPGSACCWRRAAAFAASPATKLRSGTRPFPATVARVDARSASRG